MKSIRLTGATRTYMKNYDSQSFDKIINRLIDETEDRMPKVIFDEANTSPVTISDESYDKLVSLAISNNETMDSIIMRMLLLVDGVDLYDD